MGIAISLREDYSAADLRRLAKVSKDADQSRRLLALAEIYAGGTRTAAAELGDVELQSIRDWVLRFNAGGPAALIDPKALGPEPKLNDEQRQALAALVEAGPIPAIHGVVRWAKRGTRPRALKDQRTKSAYIFGAICPARGVVRSPCPAALQYSGRAMAFG